MKRCFAIAAHPDDIEFFMTGTMMRLKEAGYELHYMNIADGCCGSTEHDAVTIARIRRDEALSACEQLGATFHESICRDLEIFYDRATLTRVASVVREVAPEIVLTLSPADYMEDHMTASRLAVTAAFARGAPNFPVDPPRAAIEDKVTVYHGQPYGNRDQLRKLVRPEIFVDVEPLLDRKIELLGLHKSQIGWLEESQHLGGFANELKKQAAEIGQMSGRFQFAEGWRRHLHLGFCSPDDDPLTDALGESCYVDSEYERE